MVEKLVELIAPMTCMECGRKGFLLCDSCDDSVLESIPSRCYRCHASALQFSVCKKCRKSVSLNKVWICSAYEGASKDLIDQMKFERASSASKDIARIMQNTLPLLPSHTVICYVPTTPSRIRVRGYDQSRLIAKHLASSMGLNFSPLIQRRANSRQLGASREDRIKQAKVAFGINQRYEIKDKNFLLVDDVTTSGATIESIAKLLKKAGAKEVNAVVFAQAII